jgi:hypothetical protein
MKKVLGVLIFLTLIIGPTVVPPCGIQALAQEPAGCCKERDALSSRNWRNNGLNLQNCTRLNDKKDGDNVYQPTGLVWWDGRCS